MIHSFFLFLPLLFWLKPIPVSLLKNGLKPNPIDLKSLLLNQLFFLFNLFNCRISFYQLTPALAGGE